VAFDTPLALGSGDHDRTRDVYLRTAHQLRLVSRTPTGGSAGATSRAPAISADGTRVAFESDSTALVGNDPNHARDVFVSDGAGRPRLVSATASGSPGNARSRAPSLSADGTLVAFESRATDLVAEAPDEGIYLARLGDDGRTPIRLAVADAYRPALSADGTTLVFETAHAYSALDRNNDVDVYALRIADHQIALVSATPAKNAADGRSLAGVPSADGHYVAFMSAASDIVRGDSGGVRDVFRRDMRTGLTVLVSRDRCGAFANGYSRYPSISANGRFVAFDSHAGDIIARPTAGEGEIYLRDMGTARTRILSTRPDGRPSTRTAFSPAISGDGSLVAFPSFGSDLVAGDDNHRVDQFSRRSGERRVRLVS
jgi:Tol biopolymer transport system component